MEWAALIIAIYCLLKVWSMESRLRKAAVELEVRHAEYNEQLKVCREMISAAEDKIGWNLKDHAAEAIEKLIKDLEGGLNPRFKSMGIKTFKLETKIRLLEEKLGFNIDVDAYLEDLKDAAKDQTEEEEDDEYDDE